METILAKPLKPTKSDENSLQNCFRLPGWQFTSVIQPHCIEVESSIVTWTGEGESEPVYATTYGLRAIRTKTQEEFLANFFIRFGARVYQARNLKEAIGIITLLKKEAEWDNYTDKLWEEKRRQRLERTKAKQAKSQSG